MNTTELNWKKWLVQGDQYLKAGTPRSGKSKFGPEIVYNILSMSLEGYIMAILDFNHSLPDNHTYTDLIFALEKVMYVEDGLKERILRYENIQSICSLEKYHVAAPDWNELDDLRGAVGEISLMAHEMCN